MRGPLLVVCSVCGAPSGERCVDLKVNPLGWRSGARAVLFAHPARAAATAPRFVTMEGGRLHRLAQTDLDGSLRSRCGLVVLGAFVVPVGDGLLERLEDCGNCSRAGL